MTAGPLKNPDSRVLKDVGFALLNVLMLSMPINVTVVLIATKGKADVVESHSEMTEHRERRRSQLTTDTTVLLGTKQTVGESIPLDLTLITRMSQLHLIIRRKK